MFRQFQCFNCGECTWVFFHNLKECYCAYCGNEGTEPTGVIYETLEEESEG